MAFQINRIVVSGNITRNAELKYSNDGKPRATFGVACNESKDHVDFFECTIFGNYGQTLVDRGLLLKGVPVTVDGRMRSWKGDKGTFWGINVNEIAIHAKNENHGQGQNGGWDQRPQQYQQPQGPPAQQYPQQGPPQQYQQPQGQPQYQQQQFPPQYGIPQQPQGQPPAQPNHGGADFNTPMQQGDIPF